jgi:hypothetical protein
MGQHRGRVKCRTVHTAGVDPQQFDSEEGIHHYVLEGDRWTAILIGSGPIEYEWNVSLAIGPDDQPARTYFGNNTQDLRYAELVDGAWTWSSQSSESSSIGSSVDTSAPYRAGRHSAD